MEIKGELKVIVNETNYQLKDTQNLGTTLKAVTEKAKS